jgi:hypothetical protein
MQQYNTSGYTVVVPGSLKLRGGWLALCSKSGLQYIGECFYLRLAYH